MEAVYLLSGMGLVLGLIIGIAVKLFGVETDPRVDVVDNLLPGANCGGCGFAGCADFARALVAGKAKPEQCVLISSASVTEIGNMLGVEVGAVIRQVAVVRCGGNNTLAKVAGNYNGVSDCRSAALVAGGAKGCLYGCLGLASCARVCPVNAIEMADGLAIVHPELCIACGKCVAACPRNLIEMVPKTSPVHVFCNSPEKGADKMKVCKAACIGCRKCVKSAEEGQMTMAGFLARVNYENPPRSDIGEVCPTKCLHPAILPVAETEKQGGAHD
jgi:RnfABCDGE-type electron transport complex B subunit